MTKVGFTGTRVGMTVAQRRRFCDFIKPSMEFHHGDCIGADAQARNLAAAMGARIISHPAKGVNPVLRAGTGYHEEREALSPLERNQKIVDDTEYLIAAPQLMVEELRSGTWATIRYARKAGKRVIIIYPDGSDGNG